MSEEQKADLARFREELTNQTNKMLNDAKNLMKEIATSNNKQAAELHKFLKEFKDSFLKSQAQFHNMLSAYYKGEIKKPVHDMLAAFHNEMQKLGNEFHQAHNAWMSFSRSMDAKKKLAHPTAEIKAPETAAPTPKRRGGRRKARSHK
jgi:uncharacterized alpha-E superfamily protein